MGIERRRTYGGGARGYQEGGLLQVRLSGGDVGHGAS